MILFDHVSYQRQYIVNINGFSHLGFLREISPTEVILPIVCLFVLAIKNAISYIVACSFKTLLITF